MSPRTAFIAALGACLALGAFAACANDSFTSADAGGAPDGAALGDGASDAGSESGADSSSDSGSDGSVVYTQTSCNGLAPTCGPSGTNDCCGSSVVGGGTYSRDNDGGTLAKVSDFRLDTYEITVGRFRKFVAAYAPNMIVSGAGKNPKNASDPGWDMGWNASLPMDVSALTSAVKCDPTYQTWTDAASAGVGNNESRPMNCITWFEAEAFCTWDGGRLPTEAEWQYAAAGGTDDRIYPWGLMVPAADASLAVYGCYLNGAGPAYCSGVTNIAPVGSVSAGNGRWGQADMAGNVSEWVQDWYAAPYPASCDNCANTTASSDRVVRGGSFGSFALYLEASNRDLRFPPSSRGMFGRNNGARCARTP